MKVFALEVIMGSPTNLSIETIGIYSNENHALRAMKNLPAETDCIVYNIEEFEVDAEPRDIFNDTYQDIKRLMDEGVIDQLVGEDGKFYYVLTEMGRDIAKAIEKNKDKDGKESI